jgi:tetratricopeptide (TPR) repeat protein
MGEFDKAIADCNKAIELDPKLAPAYGNRGQAYMKKGELDKAITDFNKAIKFDPKLAGLYDLRGNVHRKQGELEKAIADYDKAIRLDPEYAFAFCHRALARAKLGQIEEALRNVSKASEITHPHPLRQSKLAWLLATSPDARLRNADRAVELAQQTVEQSPKVGIFWKTLGVAQYRAGDWKAAVESLEKASELGCYANDPGWFFLAMAHWQLGEQEEARRWYDKAVAWMEKDRPKDEELGRFRAEAAELLGVTRKPDTKNDSARSDKQETPEHDKATEKPKAGALLKPSGATEQPDAPPEGKETPTDSEDKTD